MSGGGGVSGGGGWAAGGGLNPLLGVFGLAMSPRSANHRPNKTCLDALRDISLSLG